MYSVQISTKVVPVLGQMSHSLLTFSTPFAFPDGELQVLFWSIVAVRPVCVPLQQSQWSSTFSSERDLEILVYERSKASFILATRPHNPKNPLTDPRIKIACEHIAPKSTAEPALSLLPTPSCITRRRIQHKTQPAQPWRPTPTSPSRQQSSHTSRRLFPRPLPSAPTAARPHNSALWSPKQTSCRPPTAARECVSQTARKLSWASKRKSRRADLRIRSRGARMSRWERISMLRVRGRAGMSGWRSRSMCLV